MSVTTTSLPPASRTTAAPNGTRPFAISKQVANFYGLPFHDEATIPAGSASTRTALKVTIPASATSNIATTEVSATTPFIRPRLWNGQPSPDSFAGSSPLSTHSISKHTVAPFQSPPSSLSDRKVVAQLKEWVKARTRTPGSSDSDYHLPVTPSSAVAIPSQNDAGDRKTYGRRIRGRHFGAERK